MIQVSKVKKVFNDMGIQMSVDSINMVREDVNRDIIRMARRCKDGNVKRLTPATYHIAIGKLGEYLK